VGNAVLHWAAKGGAVDACKLLLSSGAAVNAKNKVSSFEAAAVVVVVVAEAEVVSADINLKHTTADTMLFLITRNALI
jgi:ankyrin repeat protein